MRGLALRLGCAVCVALASLTPAVGQAPGGNARLLASFDFEETDDTGRPIGLSFPMPVGWYPVGRDPLESDPNFLEQPVHRELADLRGFPSYAGVGFDDAHADSGRFSLGLALDGGSAGAYLRTGVLPAVPESTYLVTARVRTARLDNARPVLRACYVDGSGRRLSPSVRHRAAAAVDDRWADLSVRLDQAPRGAAWIVIEALLLQRDQRVGLGLESPDEDDGDAIVLSDLDARAWFDDVGVWQLPHVEVSTQHPWNVIQAPRRPEVRVGVRDVTGQELSARVTLYDLDRRPVGSVERRVGDGAPTRWRWTPELPGYGWYVADLEVFDAASTGSPVARALSSFLWTPEDAALPHPGLRRFEVYAAGLDERFMPLLAPMLDAVGAASVTLSAWRADDTASRMSFRQDRLAETLKALSLAGVRPRLGFSPVPDELGDALGIDADDAAAALAAGDDVWATHVVPVLVRQGQQVDAWQIDAARDATALTALPPAAVAELVDRFETYVPSPVLVAPRSAYSPPPASLPDRVRVLLDIPAASRSDHLVDQLAGWSGIGDRVTGHLRVDPADALSQRRRVAELVLRMLRAREAGVTSLAIDSPWTDAGAREPGLLPDPLLGAFAATARRLVDRQVVGPMPMPEGLEAMILQTADRRGSLAVWNRAAAADAASVSLYLGESPTEVDAWGNARDLSLIRGKHRLELDDVPRFIEDIDLELARFRVGFGVDEPLIVSEQSTQRRVVTLTNPWPRTISGRLRFTGPEGWTVQPFSHSFSVPAGGEVKLPIRLGFPIHEVAGPKTLSAALDFVADRRYRVDLFTPLTLGLPDVEFDASLMLVDGEDPANPDALVTCLVTNTGDRSRSLYVFANLFDHPRQERVVARIEPGETVVRRFRFAAARDELLDYPLRTGVRETNGPAILNQRLDLGDAR